MYNCRDRTQKCIQGGTSHQPRQCPAYGKACCKYHKTNHFKNIHKSVPKAGRQGVQRGRPIHGVQQIDDENWQNSDHEVGKDIDAVNIKSFTFNGIRSGTLTNFETSSQQK